MFDLKNYVVDLLSELSQQPEKAQEYFLNMVCVIKGYIYFNNKMGTAKISRKFFDQPRPIKELYLDAFKRFLESIKK